MIFIFITFACFLIYLINLWLDDPFPAHRERAEYGVHAFEGGFIARVYYKLTWYTLDKNGKLTPDFTNDALFTTEKEALMAIRKWSITHNIKLVRDNEI